MWIQNIRLGHACNSSSSHTVLLLNPGVTLKDSDVEDYSFGWQDFVAASPEAKSMYFAAALRSNLSTIVGYDHSDEIVNRLFGIGSSRDCDIDHQSIPDFPRTWDGKWLNTDFIAEFQAMLQRPDVVILGGNDQSSAEHPLKAKGVSLSVMGSSLPRDNSDAKSFVARRDPSGFWTLFNRSSGDKIRLCLNPTHPNGSVVQVPKRLAVPELVDVKITSQCFAGCDFCYQGSHPGGEHADEGYVDSVLAVLGNLHCFEVAIGGGEPTLHPGFLSFLETARCHGMVPNVTTRNLDYLATMDHGKRVAELVGKLAVSVHSYKELRRLKAILAHTKFPVEKVSLQVVDGLVDANDFAQVLHEAHEEGYSVTLLGLKASGRCNGKPKEDTSWLKVLEAFNTQDTSWWPENHFAVDTAILEQYKAEVESRFVKPSFDVREGFASCYVDCVEQSMGVSSYAGELIPLKSPHAFLKTFDTM